LAAIKKDFDFDPSQVLHVFQSLYHDCMPAKKMGLNTVWINRRKGQEGKNFSDSFKRGINRCGYQVMVLRLLPPKVQFQISSSPQ